MLTGQAAHINTSRVVVRRAGSPAASRGMTGSLQSQPGAGISVQAANAGRRRLATRFHATNAVVKIAANDSRQPQHKADMVRQAFHVESLPTANFCGNFCGADLALHAVVEIPANDRRQPPHASDMVLQALHVQPMPTANFCGVGLTTQAAHAERQRVVNLFNVTATITEIAVNDCRQPLNAADVEIQALQVEPLPPANCFGAPDIVPEMVDELPFLLMDNKKIRGNCRRGCMHGHMLQDYDDLQSAEEFLARNASAVTLPRVAVIPRPDVVRDSYWPAD